MKHYFQKFNTVFSEKEKFYFLLYLLFSLVVPIFEILSLGSIVGLIYFILEQDKFQLFLYKLNINFILEIDQFNLSLLIIFIIATMFILKNLILIFYAYIESKFRNKLVAIKSSKLFKNFISLDYLNFKKYNKSELFNNIILEVARVIDYFFSIIIILRETVMILLLIVSLLFFNIFYTFSLLLSLVAFSSVLYVILKKKLFGIGEKLILFQERLFNKINQIADLFKIIVFGKKQDFFISNFDKLNNERAQNIFYQQFIKKLPRIFLEVYIIFLICLFLIYKINIGSDLKSLIPFLSLLVLIAIRFLPAFSNLNIAFTTLKFSEASFKNYEINIKKTQFLKQNTNNINPKKIPIKDINNISIENVSFSYDGKINILNNLSFKIYKNEIFGVFGKSGSGKSTLVDIISGLIIPQKGIIKINDDHEIQKNISFWQNSIGYVTQDPVLINDTLKNNICLGEDVINEEKYFKAINISGVDQLLKNLPNRADTLVGELGSKFSGGEKQMIAIARAIYREPKILIFDEATSAIDKESEHKILEKIKILEKDNLIIIISHDEKLKSICKKLIVLNESNR